MIPIARSAPPRVLVENGEAWTTELLAALTAEDPVPKQLLYRYGHPDVFVQLAEDAHSKCMYCESKIAHVSFPHVEHIAPKTAYPERTFEWENLGLACQACNTAKGGQYDTQTPPVDPYSDDPSDHFYAFGEEMRARPGSERGLITLQLVGLNRADLLEARSRRLSTIQKMIEKYARTDNDPVKAALLQEICEELSADREFIMSAKAMIQGMEISCDLTEMGGNPITR